MLKQKLKALLIHLGFSILLVTLLVGLAIYFWFPTLYLGVSDFTSVAKIIVSVDLVLGPLLTFVVYQPHKKSLKFDLSVIVAIQLAALSYGLYALYQVHPVYVAFNVDRYSLVSARDAHPEKAKYPEYKVSKFDAGKLAYAKMPEDPEARNELLFDVVLQKGDDLDARVEYYEPYQDNIDRIVERSLDIQQILADEAARSKAAGFLKNYGDQLDRFAFLPLASATHSAIIVIDRETGEPVSTMDVDPWEIEGKQQKQQNGEPSSERSEKKPGPKAGK